MTGDSIPAVRRVTKEGLGADLPRIRQSAERPHQPPSAERRALISMRLLSPWAPSHDIGTHAGAGHRVSPALHTAPFPRVVSFRPVPNSVSGT